MRGYDSFLLDFFNRPAGEILSWVIVVLFVVALLPWAVIRIRAWYFEDDDTSEYRDEMLIQIRDSHREGNISDEEFRKIKGQLLSDGQPAPSTDTTLPDESPNPIEEPEQPTD